MKKKLVVVACLVIGMTFIASAAHKDKTKDSEQILITTTNDTISYAFGANVVEQGLTDFLKQQGIDNNNPEKLASFLEGLNETLSAKGGNSEYIVGLGVGNQIYKMIEDFAKQAFVDQSVGDMDINLITKGINDALIGETLTIDSSSVIINKVMADATKRKEQERELKNAKQKKASQDFMSENKTKDGVITLPSGLQYKIVTKGDGEVPRANDNVKVNYTGTLIDGTEFDSSYKRNEPLTIQVSEVIKGWSEALQLMPVGSKWILYIPYDLAYGETGIGEIPAYSDLVFEVDLLSVEKPQADIKN